MSGRILRNVTVSLLLVVGACAGAQEQAQVGSAPPAKPPSWGPSLYPVPETPTPSPELAPVKPQDERDSQRAPRLPRTPRHAVEQVLTPTPRIIGSTAVNKPMPAPAPPVAPPRGTLPANCGAAGCYDPSGQRLGTGVGNAVTTPQGQLCTRGVVGVQCF